METLNTTTGKIDINMFTQRTAEMCINRESELNGSKGKFVVETAKKIVAGTVTQKELNEFKSYSDFISMSFM